MSFQVRQRLLGVCGVLSAAALMNTVPSAQISVDSGLRIDVPARSMKDLRDQNLVKQRFDFSCGAAALATLLRYGLGDAVTEGQILTDLFNRLSDDEKAVVRRTGFSLLHLQRVAQGRNYNAQGFRLEPEELSMLDGPVLVFIEPRGYKHFAVLRGVRGDRVYLADPSRGNVRMPVYTFLDSWLQDDGKGIIFVVEPKTGLPGATSVLTPPSKGRLHPEVMTAREMLAVGNPLLRLPEHSR
ncbi:MAG TPA: C39 family peptidase [Vicinamibacterales bacterium]|nr:C39 family peptidase [Vicinamibacterales bacterium]